jgi:hypothetical protein
MVFCGVSKDVQPVESIKKPTNPNINIDKKNFFMTLSPFNFY